MKQSNTKEHKLSLPEVLACWWGWHGQQANADALLLNGPVKHDTHPLTVIAKRNLKSQLPPHKLLHLDALTEWLAASASLSISTLTR